MPAQLDFRGMSCPMPIIELARFFRAQPAGTSVEIVATDRAFPADVETWCRRTGNELVSLTTKGGEHFASIRKTR